eukprot:2506117-Prymnesium_polylepis.2
MTRGLGHRPFGFLNYSLREAAAIIIIIIQSRSNRGSGLCRGGANPRLAGRRVRDARTIV